MPDSRSFEERVFARFDALDARLTSLESKIDGLDGRLTTLEEKVDVLDGRLSSLESKVDGIDGRLTALEEKVDARLRETRPVWEAMQARLESVENEVKEINRGVKVLHKDILQVRVDQEELRERIEKLEFGADPPAPARYPLCLKRVTVR
jgi:chromosome segregation ATPase